MNNPTNENEHTHKIEDIKRHLYDPDGKVVARHREGILHSAAYKVADTWKKIEGNDKTVSTKIKSIKSSFFKKFFIFALIFFVCALGFAGYKYFSGVGKVSSDNIEITMLGNAFINGGEELPLQIEIVNKNNASLELANLIIEYPSGASDDPNDMIRLPRESLGTIPAGGRVERNTKVILYGDQGSVRNVKIRLEYHPQGSNAIFTKEKEYPVTINSSPISLNIDAPVNISSNQEIMLTITTSLNTTLPGNKIMLKADYPSGFIFESASISPAIGNSLWDLSDLTQATPKTIAIKGRLNGQDGDQQAFHFYVGTVSPSNQSVVQVVYNSLLHTVDIIKPFLEAKIIINGQNLENYSTPGNDIVRSSISWANNLTSRITNVQIVAHFSGNAFDKSAIGPGQGYFDSVNNQIIWDENTIDNFSSVEPGEKGNLDFSFKPLSLIGSNQTLKDPQVVIDVSIKGQEPQEGSTFTDVNNFEKLVVKILSDFQLAASAVYSSGAMPPQAEKETNYTVTWTLSNSTNAIVNAEARASLPVYVKWVGLAQGINENISYNQTTREVIWKIGGVKPNTGFNSINREASFVVSLLPSLSQVGSVPQLVKEVFLTGQDSFAENQVHSSYGAITTYLPNDPSFETGNERVVR